MPEGPEVRKYADALDEVLNGRVILSLAARTKDARNWLAKNEQRLIGRSVERVVSQANTSSVTSPAISTFIRT